MAKRGLAIGKKAAPFKLNSTQGIKSLDDYKGKPLVIVFLRGTWCQNCQKQMPELNSFYERFLEKGVNLIAIAGQTLKGIKVYTDNFKIKFPILSDETRAVIKAYEVFTPIKWDSFHIAIPSTYIMDESQNIRFSYIGENQSDRPSAQEILEIIDTLSIVNTPQSLDEELNQFSLKLNTTSDEFTNIQQMNDTLSENIHKTRGLMDELISMTQIVNEMSGVIMIP